MDKRNDTKQNDPDPSFVMESVRKLAGIMAHDFNNVLTGVLGFCMLMQQDMEEDNQFLQYAKEIEKAATRGRELTDLLMVISRKKPLAKEKVNINELITSYQGELNCLTKEERTIALDLGDVAPVDADPAQFTQALKNIVAHAAGIVKGGDKIGIETREVSAGEEALKEDPSLTESGGYVLISVRARAKGGIDTEEVTHIFQPYRGKKRDMEEGCLLTIARDILKEHGGTLTAKVKGSEEIVYKMWLPSPRS